MALLSKGAARTLRAVARDFLMEPRRLDMSDWLYKWKNDETSPPCGVVGCIAGRIVMREVGIMKVARMKPLSFDKLISSAWSRAADALGLDTDASARLFLPASWPTSFSRAYNDAKRGSYQRAGIVADRIEHFIATGK